MVRLSLLNFVLLGVSNITAAVIPLKNGTAIDSTGGGVTETVIFRQGGMRSWTVSDMNAADNPNEDGASGSSDIFKYRGTYTEEIGNFTANGTTALNDE